MNPWIRPALFCLSALSVFWAVDVHAQQTDDPLRHLLQDESAVRGIREWKGFVDVLSRHYTRSAEGFDRTDRQTLLWGEAEVDLRLSDELTAFFRLRLYADVGSASFGRAHIAEAFMTYSANAWDLRGGLLVENWGVADTFNPVDVLNARDLATDVLDPLKLGQPGLRLRRLFAGGETFGEPTVTAYWMPGFQRTRYPPVGQRLHPAFGGATFAEADIDPQRLDRQFWALRYQSRLDTSLFRSDLQVLASHGPDRSPPIRQVTEGRVAPAYQRVRTAGFGLRAVPDARFGRFWSTLTLKAEVARRSFAGYSQGPVAESQDYWVYVIGVDRDLPNVFLDHDSLALTVEYVWESETHDGVEKQRLFQHDIVFRALWQANDFSRSTFQFRGVIDARDTEHILEATFATQLRAVSEALRLELTYQLVGVERGSGSLLSELPNISSVSMGMRWDFASERF